MSAHAIWNTPSKRVIEKPGFCYTGENPRSFEKKGKPVAEYEYEMTAQILVLDSQMIITQVPISVTTLC